MSPEFVKKLKKELKCKQCDASKADRRKFCPGHLADARGMWMLRSLLRRRAGLCSYCLRKTRVGMVRCKVHADINKKKCLAWNVKFGKEADARSLKKRQVWISQARAAGDTRSVREMSRERGRARADGRKYLLVTLSAKYPEIVDRYATLR